MVTRLCVPLAINRTTKLLKECGNSCSSPLCRSQHKAGNKKCTFPSEMISDVMTQERISSLEPNYAIKVYVHSLFGHTGKWVPVVIYKIKGAADEHRLRGNYDICWLFTASEINRRRSLCQFLLYFYYEHRSYIRYVLTL